MHYNKEDYYKGTDDLSKDTLSKYYERRHARMVSDYHCIKTRNFFLALCNIVLNCTKRSILKIELNLLNVPVFGIYLKTETFK